MAHLRRYYCDIQLLHLVVIPEKVVTNDYRQLSACLYF